MNYDRPIYVVITLSLPLSKLPSPGRGSLVEGSAGGVVGTNLQRRRVDCSWLLPMGGERYAVTKLLATICWCFVASHM
jgi:hypothetical protein